MAEIDSNGGSTPDVQISGTFPAGPKADVASMVKPRQIVRVACLFGGGVAHHFFRTSFALLKCVKMARSGPKVVISISLLSFTKMHG